ncbi:MICOS complex subunit MIC25 isoform X4 [Manis pentadactyla]|uniref:MICOS complex subunit MIC25 isoform X4 n=1 Tax=Manis pentadactyla TaxID=143292 RepID=UPI00255C94C3|nr:MICOS complex subunit MIC25 isoform X4 [Manis pentadactyla]
MGSTESREGSRVSFGTDEEERVRVLQGIRLSENVVNLMKDSSQPSQVGQPAPPAPPPPAFGTSKGPEKDSKLLRSECGSGQQSLGMEEELLKRYKQELATVQDELFQMVTREREAAKKHQNVALQQREGGADQEKRKAARLARALESQEAELRRWDTLYKEQLGSIERKAPQAGARVLRAAGPDPPLLPGPPAGGAPVLRPSQGLPALREHCPQGLRSILHCQ